MGSNPVRRSVAFSLLRILMVPGKAVEVAVAESVTLVSPQSDSEAVANISTVLIAIWDSCVMANDHSVRFALLQAKMNATDNSLWQKPPCDPNVDSGNGFDSSVGGGKGTGFGFGRKLNAYGRFID